ncbi:hypothetical protein BJ980_001554 [Nocardioides daedukensis]|jgi:hypothetical protein|uniref:Uncharacterized protein n=1 Tax=Nocardioides daedukensis TaxID=634462 RepID=A0A7Y9UQI1_9ACTN|nr:hypothetical protein [Nocardioides daedukensis]NYG58631.1 hypothetical protein [Nocardioides daedukensis]
MSENRPEPVAEEPQLHPGGVDSTDDPKYGETPGEPVPRDLDPDDNPAVEDVAPDEITEPDDKQQEPDNGEADLDAGETGESEPPA